MDKSEVIEKLKKYAELVVNFIAPEKIVLYGSYARGDQREYSDIDVAIIVSEINCDILEIETQLFKLRRDIDFLIEPQLFDEKHDPSGFLEHILKYGEVIYDRSAANT